MTNLLVHGNFNGNYSPYRTFDNMLIAKGWEPFWRQRTMDDPEWKWRKPEANPAAPYEDRIHSGTNAQHWFTFEGTHSAGILQRVKVPAGARLRLSAWSQVWSTSDDNPAESGSKENGKKNGHLETRIGLDLNGGLNPWSSDVVWSDWLKCYDDYKQAVLEGFAQAGYVTVILHSECMYPVKHNDVYFDDAELVIVGDKPEPDDPADPKPDSDLVTEVRRIADALEAIAAK